MATTNIDFDHGSSIGSAVHNALSSIRTGGHYTLKSVLAVMQTHIDGDGSSISQFDSLVKNAKYGGYDPVQGSPTDAQRTMAKASWDELNSMFAKITSTTGDVTGTATLQACAKHGV